MQDRLAEMTQRAIHTDAEKCCGPRRPSPRWKPACRAWSSASTVEAQQQALPDVVRAELNQLADRIEAVRSAAAGEAERVQTAAVIAAQNELRDIEGRILGLSGSAGHAGDQSATATDLQDLRTEIGAINRRIDAFGAGLASDDDVNALRVAMEQLSARVAQGPDMRPWPTWTGGSPN